MHNILLLLLLSLLLFQLLLLVVILLAVLFFQFLNVNFKGGKLFFASRVRGRRELGRVQYDA